MSDKIHEFAGDEPPEIQDIQIAPAVSFLHSGGF
jgi:hypothetical protein